MNDGGPAFPAVIAMEYEPDQGKSYPNYSESGMSLRDWFAGQALNGWYTNTGSLPSESHHKNYAEHFYKMADAMLTERIKTIEITPV